MCASAGDGSVLGLVWTHAKAKRAVGFEINDDLVETARQRLVSVGAAVDTASPTDAGGSCYGHSQPVAHYRVGAQPEN